MQLKLDENLDVGLAVWLDSMGHDAKTVRDEHCVALLTRKSLPPLSPKNAVW